MPRKNKGWMEKFGPWAFIVGLIIAMIASISNTVVWFLGVLGLIVGLLNISDQEARMYLLASITFLISASALSATLTKLIERIPVIGNYLNFIDPLLANIVLFVAPGAGIVALKALYAISKD